MNCAMKVKCPDSIRSFMAAALASLAACFEDVCPIAAPAKTPIAKNNSAMLINFFIKFGLMIITGGCTNLIIFSFNLQQIPCKKKAIRLLTNGLNNLNGIRDDLYQVHASIHKLC